MLGEVLGNYRVVEALDSGGMGSVYRAEHTQLGKLAAIKLLRPELTTNAEIVQRFFNEAKAATAVRHPGIIEVYDFGYTKDGQAYFVMELLDGEPLGKRIKAQGRLSEVEAARIAKGIANVLKAAHAKGIVHRDLKPDNVFLIPGDEGDRVKVLDFGVAKLADVFPAETRHTQTGALMGTPLYMAPEQARSAAAIDHRADLYSLGCVLYELLAGIPPFNAEGAGEIIALQMFSPPQPLRDRLAQVSPELEAIVMKLLEKEPEQRYQNAADVVTALSGVASRLSARLSAELPNAGLSSPRFTYTPSQQLTVPSRGPLTGTLQDDRPTEFVPGKKSSMPLVAGIVTVVLAGGAAVFALAQSSDEPSKTAPAVVEPGSNATKPAETGPGKKTVDTATGKAPETTIVKTPDKAPEKNVPVAPPDIVATPVTTPDKKPKGTPKKGGTKPEVAGTPVTRPDGVEPLGTPDDPNKPTTTPDVRTPITQKPLETSIDDDEKKKTP
ncbi:MAG: protein kinase domain-containing protein [Kofleriaceae bacterium]